MEHQRGYVPGSTLNPKTHLSQKVIILIKQALNK
jgi:hypothetical protein